MDRLYQWTAVGKSIRFIKRGPFMAQVAGSRGAWIWTLHRGVELVATGGAPKIGLAIYNAENALLDSKYV